MWRGGCEGLKLLLVTTNREWIRWLTAHCNEMPVTARRELKTLVRPLDGSLQIVATCKMYAVCSCVGIIKHEGNGLPLSLSCEATSFTRVKVRVLHRQQTWRDIDWSRSLHSFNSTGIVDSPLVNQHRVRTTVNQDWHQETWSTLNTNGLTWTCPNRSTLRKWGTPRAKECYHCRRQNNILSRFPFSNCSSDEGKKSS